MRHLSLKTRVIKASGRNGVTEAHGLDWLATNQHWTKMKRHFRSMPRHDRTSGVKGPGELFIVGQHRQAYLAGDAQLQLFGPDLVQIVTGLCGGDAGAGQDRGRLVPPRGRVGHDGHVVSQGVEVNTGQAGPADPAQGVQHPVEDI